MTVKELREMLATEPDDAPVFFHDREDGYVEAAGIYTASFVRKTTPYGAECYEHVADPKTFQFWPLVDGVVIS